MKRKYEKGGKMRERGAQDGEKERVEREEQEREGSRKQRGRRMWNEQESIELRNAVKIEEVKRGGLRL